MLKRVGFDQTELVEATGFNSSPVTKGVLIRASKPSVSIAIELKKSSDDPLEKYQEFLHAVYAEGALDRKTRHLIALGASLTVGSESLTKRCLAAAKELGVTDEELRETTAIAMSLGAERITAFQESALTSRVEGGSDQAKEKPEREKGADRHAPST